MIPLNPEQRDAVRFEGPLVVTACPGSGKTRVLTARTIRGLSELTSSRERVIALTFTNRAADEIQARLDEEEVDGSRLWAGTIHAFALEWILRPYAPYCRICRHGFSVADEFFTDQMLGELKVQHGLQAYSDINTCIDRVGFTENPPGASRAVFSEYKRRLRIENLIDYDDVLYLAYSLLRRNAEIAATLGSIIRLICVDEVQDIQDLQYGILSQIYKASPNSPALFFVGDANQSIYESLGALTKSPSEIAAEFGLGTIGHMELKGNYRSTQRIIEVYRQLRPKVPRIKSLATYAEEPGLVTFDDQKVGKDQLPQYIASLVKESLDAGIAAQEICVLAPQWRHVRPLARRLIRELPDVEFDAPGLSPLYSSRENVWYKVARLALTEPTPSRSRTRARWAKELLGDLSAIQGIVIPDELATPRRLLRTINGLSSPETEGMPYLQDLFTQLLARFGMTVSACAELETAHKSFFAKAANAIATSEGGIPVDVESFRRFFRHPTGVVVNTCHGVKGEEFETVIAFGLLRGFIPHWSIILKGPDSIAQDRESKLLYVICSRAKRRLHLIAETGRVTQKGKPYETARLLKCVNEEYDHRRSRAYV